MKLDVLAFGAHPDDVELACAGTIAKLKSQGKMVGVVDLTAGELGTRGTPDQRLEEAKASAEILKLDARKNLDLGDGWFEIDKKNKLRVVEMIRKYQPEVILINAMEDRHLDHPRAAELVKQAAFLSGLAKVETTHHGHLQERWRPKHIFHYIQYQYMEPSFVVDISDHFETKMDSIKAFGSQFFDPDSKEKSTLISGEHFLSFIEARARECGAAIKVQYGEGFISSTPLKYDIGDLL